MVGFRVRHSGCSDFGQRGLSDKCHRTLQNAATMVLTSLEKQSSSTKTKTGLEYYDTNTHDHKE